MRAARLARLAWQEACSAPGRLVLLASGVAVGVAALAIFLALGAGVESVVMHRVLGVLPDQIVVEPAVIAVGPLKLSGGSGLDESIIDRIAHLPGVAGVLRRIRLPVPAHLTASYGGHTFYTDLLLEAVDPGLVADDLPDPSVFSLRSAEAPIPAVLPTAMIDVLNVGFSVNTGLPQLNEQMIVGHHFTLDLGSSSFRRGPTVSRRCEVVGISPRIGVGGPAIPRGYLPELDRALRARGGEIPACGVSSLTVRLRSPADLPGVAERVEAMGLAIPQQARAAQVTAGIRAGAATLVGLGLLVLGVAAAGIANGMALAVKDEAPDIGLLRAVGASRADVLVLYLMRAAWVGAVGGGAGLVAATAITWAANRVAAGLLPGLLAGHERLAALTPSHLLAALLFGILASVLAGLVPARQAARLNPAAALRER